MLTTLMPQAQNVRLSKSKPSFSTRARPEFKCPHENSRSAGSSVHFTSDTKNKFTLPQSRGSDSKAAPSRKLSKASAKNAPYDSKAGVYKFGEEALSQGSTLFALPVSISSRLPSPIASPKSTIGGSSGDMIGIVRVPSGNTLSEGCKYDDPHQAACMHAPKEPTQFEMYIQQDQRKSDQRVTEHDRDSSPGPGTKDNKSVRPATVPMNNEMGKARCQMFKGKSYGACLHRNSAKKLCRSRDEVDVLGDKSRKQGCWTLSNQSVQQELPASVWNDCKSETAQVQRTYASQECLFIKKV